MEMNKVNAPSLLLEDYNYFINKAINQYINKIYNTYELNQQRTDDIRVLKSSAVLIPQLNNDFVDAYLYSKVYEVDLPDDYFHISSCIVEYKVQSRYKCYKNGDTALFGAKRLTADIHSQIINNFYMRPSYKNPYFYINNVTVNPVFPTEDSQESLSRFKVEVITPGNGTKLFIQKDINPVNILEFVYNSDPLDDEELRVLFPNAKQFSTLSELKTLLTELGVSANVKQVGQNEELYISDVYKVWKQGALLKITQLGAIIDLANKEAQKRYGNRSKVRMEIRYGLDDKTFKINKIYIDYIKTPQYVILSQQDVDNVEDSSQKLEFPDYVCYEILNELVMLLMENASDPRLQTNIPTHQSIADPAGAVSPNQQKN